MGHYRLLEVMMNTVLTAARGVDQCPAPSVVLLGQAPSAGGTDSQSLAVNNHLFGLYSYIVKPHL